MHTSVLTYSSTSKYVCSAIASTIFVLCVVVESDLQSVSILDAQPLPPTFDFLYHRYLLLKSLIFKRLIYFTFFRLDLFPELLCRRPNQAIVTDASAVMLSPITFVDSGKYSVTAETLSMVKKWVILLKIKSNFFKINK